MPYVALVLGLATAGCHSYVANQSCTNCRPNAIQPDLAIPREGVMVTQPPYRVEPPDILLIDAVQVVPKPPYKIHPLDQLQIVVTNNPIKEEPIEGIYSVDPDGKVILGFRHPSVRVAGMTIEQANKAIEAALGVRLKGFSVQVALAQSRALQQIRGDHLVRPDGTIGLGTYGSVYVAGLTLNETKAAIETYLSRYLLDPEVSVDVFAYNSKVYYIITDGGGNGEQVVRLPATGNETVLDALSQVGGISAAASKSRIWLTRPSPVEECDKQVLAVNWKAITQCGDTSTNYQVLPGDRIYVASNPLISVATYIQRLTAPIEQLFGITLLGNSTINAFRIGTSGTGIGGVGRGF
jgi:polysaccharide export outer membrane protein